MYAIRSYYGIGLCSFGGGRGRDFRHWDRRYPSGGRARTTIAPPPGPAQGQQIIQLGDPGDRPLDQREVDRQVSYNFV